MPPSALSMPPAFLTIIAQNYVPTARVLARTLAAQHPEATLHIVTIDQDLSDAFRAFPNVVVHSIDEIGLPDFSCFTHKYDVTELCTAIKPFAIAHLMDAGLAEVVIYLDPDIIVMSPLSEVLDALEAGSIVLTPHLLAPYNDQAMPSELTILRAGAFNLGFIGVRNDRSGRALLDWWRERLFSQCINDPDRGLFVDQRWIDLAPGLFDGVRILRHPGYNIAYWNLHERTLDRGDDGYSVNGVPLRFFHFSGFSPNERSALSRHQSRHDTRDNPLLRTLLGDHADALIAEGFVEFIDAPYRFASLPNGVEVSPVIRRALREMIERGLEIPDPVADADAFCERLCRPIFSTAGEPITPLQWSILQLEPMVGRAFPAAAISTRSDDFIAWCKGESGKARGLSTLIRRTRDVLLVDQELEAILSQIDADLPLGQFPGLVLDRGAFQRLIYWAKAFGVVYGRWTEAGVRALDGLWPEMRQIFNLCASETSALDTMKDPSGGGAERLRPWLLQITDRFGVSPEAIRLFCAAVRQQPAWFADVAVFAAPPQQAWPGVYDLTAPGVRSLHEGQLERRASLLSKTGPSLTDQLEIWRCNQAALSPGRRARLAGSIDHPLPPLNAKAAIEAQALLRTEPRSKPHAGRLNLAGVHAAPTGMGELARALNRTCAAAGFDVAPVTLPTTADLEPLGPFPFLFGIPLPHAEFSITAVNADTVDRAVGMLPRHYWAEKNIGYWMWETDRLPECYRDAARPFDEIWTASESARAAIARSVEVPVRVLPLALDFARLDGAQADRARFGLPQDAVIFGYFFDFDSVLERKNPLGVIEAFKAAFGDDPAALLLLKVNGRIPHTYAAQTVWTAAERSNIRILTGAHSRRETLDLMACLDAYVSLHRCEGFGLTCAEAMALGKPVIATDYSGNRDFMDPDCALMVPAGVTATDRSFGPYPAGSLWASPDLSIAADMMQRLRSASERDRIGGLGRQQVRRLLSPQAVATRLDQLLGRAGSTPGFRETSGSGSGTKGL